MTLFEVDILNLILILILILILNLILILILILNVILILILILNVILNLILILNVILNVIKDVLIFANCTIIREPLSQLRTWIVGDILWGVWNRHLFLDTVMSFLSGKAKHKLMGLIINI